MAIGQFYISFDGSRIPLPDAILQEYNNRPLVFWKRNDTPHVLCFSAVIADKPWQYEDALLIEPITEIKRQEDSLVLSKDWQLVLGNDIVIAAINNVCEIWPAKEYESKFELLTNSELEDVFAELGL